MTTRNFAITGVGGFVAPRHLQAIRDTGHRVVAAVDPNDSVGILDRFGFEIRYFKEVERFERHLDKLRRASEDDRVHYVSICSPNHVHDAHVRLALRSGADALCEKPLVITPWNLDALEALEAETGRRVFTVLQLRLHPDLVALRDRLMAAGAGGRHQVDLTYITSRGPWYDVSWKGSESHSGGIAMNIGIHFFDLLLWLFGSVRSSVVHHREPRCASGRLELDRADVTWFLSVDVDDLPAGTRGTPAMPAARPATYRMIRVDGTEVEFSEGFTDLHTRVYEGALAGRGFGIADARASIELVHRIRTGVVDDGGTAVHPRLMARKGRR